MKLLRALVFGWPRAVFTCAQICISLLNHSFVEERILLLNRERIWLEWRIWFKCQCLTANSIAIGPDTLEINTCCIMFSACLRSLPNITSFRNNLLRWTYDFLRLIPLLWHHPINFNSFDTHSRWTGNKIRLIDSTSICFETFVLLFLLQLLCLKVKWMSFCRLLLWTCQILSRHLYFTEFLLDLNLILLCFLSGCNLRWFGWSGKF